MFCVETGTLHGQPDKPLFKSRFIPVYDRGSGGSENEKFWEATPSGVLELNCTKEQFFEVGKSYFIDIQEA